MERVARETGECCMLCVFLPAQRRMVIADDVASVHALGYRLERNKPMSVLWGGTTTRGALFGGLLGLVSAVVMVVLSKAVWVQTLGYPQALFPYDNPALFSMPLAFLGIWLFSKLDASQRARAEQAAFPAQYVRSETGIGAAAAHQH